MKNITLAVVALLLGMLAANAQQFKKRFVSKLDENLTNIQMEWISLDTDTLLDLAITGSANDQLKIIPYKNLNTSFFGKQASIATGMKSGYLQITDWNKDNKLDLVLGGKTLINTDAIFTFKSNGDFTLTKDAQKLIDHSGQFRIADFDSDAAPDILTFGPSFIRIYRNSGTSLMKEFELTTINPTDVSAFDMNGDGTTDFAVTGIDNQNKIVTSVFIGGRNFKYTRKDAATPLNGPLSLGDANNDGLFDLFVTGKDKSTLWINNGDTLIANNSFNGFPKPSVFTGDMTSDGNIDILLPGGIRELNGNTTAIDSVGVIIQRMGDHDRDGDLDLVQVKDSIGSQWLKYFENTVPGRNANPELPSSFFAISTFERTFIYWDDAHDDHTPAKALTYDVWLGTAGETVVAPTVDLGSFKRMAVRHGNAGANTSIIIKGLADTRYFYQIMTVDNAYNGSVSACGGGVLPCFDLVHNDVQTCKGSTVKLAGGKDAVWFSLAKGFLETADTLSFVASATDTLFAFVPQSTDCSKNKVYVVHVNDAPPSEKETLYTCKDKVIKLEVDPGWTKTTWDTSPPTTNVLSINYTVKGPDTVTVRAGEKDCSYKKQFFIKISEPQVTIAGDGFQVMKGGSVQLEASGSAEEWQWTPPVGLNNPSIADPIATPDVTTEYTVTGIDSVGCKASATTHVLVQSSAFVPNLFTPNGDGKNDNLLIYGLNFASGFKFKIFNREGSVVYETKDISHATGTGWNGFVNTTRQPSGIYYWKIEGESTDGSKLLLNGKTTGSILLVH